MTSPSCSPIELQYQREVQIADRGRVTAVGQAAQGVRGEQPFPQHRPKLRGAGGQGRPRRNRRISLGKAVGHTFTTPVVRSAHSAMWSDTTVITCQAWSISVINSLADQSLRCRSTS